MKKDLCKPLSINIPKGSCKTIPNRSDMGDRISVDPLNIGNSQVELNLQCKETADEFIFSCIEPFVESMNMTETKISKQNLVEAVQYINLRNIIIGKYGCYISMDNDLETALKKERELRKAYSAGYHDGYVEASKIIEQHIRGKEKENGEEEN